MSTHSRSGRAWRRHDRARLKMLRAGHQNFVWREKHLTPSLRAVVLGIYSQTPSPCACVFCQNPRRIFKALTLAEKKSLDALGDGLEDWRVD